MLPRPSEEAKMDTFCPIRSPFSWYVWKSMCIGIKIAKMFAQFSQLLVEIMELHLELHAYWH
jgi:hypothetical protein